MAAAFPTFVLLKPTVKRSIEHDTIIQTSSGRKETRARTHSTPIYRWHIEIEALRRDKNSNEILTLCNHFESCAGAWDTFSYTDPISLQAMTVRYDKDQCEIQQIGLDGYWSAALDLVRVI